MKPPLPTQLGGAERPPCPQGRSQHHPGGADAAKISKTLISSTAVAQEENGIALREPPERVGVTVVFPFRVQGAALVVFGESERPLLAAKAVFRNHATEILMSTIKQTVNPDSSRR